MGAARAVGEGTIDERGGGRVGFGGRAAGDHPVFAHVRFVPIAVVFRSDVLQQMTPPIEVIDVERKAR